VTLAESSPIAQALHGLEALSASWKVELGSPEGPGWIAGGDLCDAGQGPFNALLVRIGERLKTEDKRTIAASFALRFGWASVMAIGPFLRFQCVPDVGLDNVSFKFKASTFFERAAVHVPRGVVPAGDPRAQHPSVREVADQQALLRVLRHELVAQSVPVVDALHAWSGFAPKGSWGMLTSSWASHFTGLSTDSDDQRGMVPLIDALFARGDVVDAMRPRLHAVTFESATHLFQRRASCCRYYLLPQGDLCASCPLVSHEERLSKNLAWMQTQAARQRKSGGHA
jgi:hypothetical protein